MLVIDAVLAGWAVRGRRWAGSRWQAMWFLTLVGRGRPYDPEMPPRPSLTIEPLTAERFDDLASLFRKGGDPKWCWCAYFRVRGLDWSNSTPRSNRDRLKALAGQDPAPGLVAYREGEVIGWVGLGPRDAFDRLAHSKVLAPVDDKPVWSIVCFVVARAHRGRGVARALLEAAVDYARDQGATLLEGYPVDVGTGRRGASSVYTGTLGMFERAGFKEVARRQWNRSSPIRPIVRRAVRPRRRPE
jgi:GNAT superfamily N-acetyltransferase